MLNYHLYFMLKFITVCSERSINLNWANSISALLIDLCIEDVFTNG